MDFYCPVCNGLQSLVIRCPVCPGMMTDGGRIDDYTGPYAPYRPIDDLKMTNGFPDMANHECMHQLFCTQCGLSFQFGVKERKS